MFFKEIRNEIHRLDFDQVPFSFRNKFDIILWELINEGFNMAKPWADAAISKRPFSGNTGAVDDKGNVQRNLNDANFNRMWEYNNRGLGSKVVAEPKQ